jgi:hypothetical protein
MCTPRAAALVHIHHLIFTAYTGSLTTVAAVLQRHFPHPLCMHRTPPSPSTYTISFAQCTPACSRSSVRCVSAIRPMLCVYTPAPLLSSTYTNPVSQRIQYRLAHSVYSTGLLTTVTAVRHCHSLHAFCVHAHTTVLVHVHHTVLTGRTALSDALPAALL